MKTRLVKSQAERPIQKEVSILNLLVAGGLAHADHLGQIFLNLSQNQNPVLTWYASRIRQADIRSYLWLGLSLTNLHLPRFLIVAHLQRSVDEALQHLTEHRQLVPRGVRSSGTQPLVRNEDAEHSCAKLGRTICPLRSDTHVAEATQKNIRYLR